MLEADEKIKFIQQIEELPGWTYRSIENMENYAKHFKMRYFQQKYHYETLVRMLDQRYPEISRELTEDVYLVDGKPFLNEKSIHKEISDLDKLCDDWNWQQCMNEVKKDN